MSPTILPFSLAPLLVLGAGNSPLLLFQLRSETLAHSPLSESLTHFHPRSQKSGVSPMGASPPFNRSSDYCIFTPRRERGKRRKKKQNYNFDSETKLSCGTKSAVFSPESYQRQNIFFSCRLESLLLFTARRQTALKNGSLIGRVEELLLRVVMEAGSSFIVIIMSSSRSSGNKFYSYSNFQSCQKHFLN